MKTCVRYSTTSGLFIAWIASYQSPSGSLVCIWLAGSKQGSA